MHPGRAQGGFNSPWKGGLNPPRGAGLNPPLEGVRVDLIHPGRLDGLAGMSRFNLPGRLINRPGWLGGLAGWALAGWAAWLAKVSKSD